MAVRIAPGELARRFLLLGLVGFGGPAAHVALMERELVHRRGWLDRGEFLDLYAETQLIPGPNSTELAILIGLRTCGGRGAAIAGLCFILPAALIVSLLAFLYQRAGTLPAVLGVFTALTPVVLALVLDACLRLVRPLLADPLRVTVLVGAVVLASLGVPELLVLLGGALAVVVARGVRARAATALAADPLTLFFVFLKIGSVLFGSGYVLLALLRAELVERLHWIGDRVLVDAVVVGQVTPGPLFTTATFVGWQVAGAAGAALATIAIFLPAFVLAPLASRGVDRLRGSAVVRATLDGVTAASLALMVVVIAQLGAPHVREVAAWVVFVGSVVALRMGVASWWLIGAGVAWGMLRAV